MNLRREPRQGFTLLELLVVTGILLVLAGLLAPSFRGAKQAAQRARCTSNLRQLMLAAQLYWDEHEGAAFRYRRGSLNGGDVFWFGWLERGAEGQRTFDPQMGALFPYLQGLEVGLCPALAYHSAAFKHKARGAAQGYGYNLNLSAPTNEPPVVLTRARRPAHLVVFGDAAQINTFQFPATPANPMVEEFYYLSSREPTAHFRHLGKTQAAFLDGHVEGLPHVPGSLDSRLPEARVGLIAETHLQLE